MTFVWIGVTALVVWVAYFVGYYRGEADGYKIATDSQQADAKISAHEKDELDIYRPAVFDEETWKGLSDDLKREIIDAVGPF